MIINLEKHIAKWSSFELFLFISIPFAFSFVLEDVFFKNLSLLLGQLFYIIWLNCIANLIFINKSKKYYYLINILSVIFLTSIICTYFEFCNNYINYSFAFIYLSIISLISYKMLKVQNKTFDLFLFIMYFFGFSIYFIGIWFIQPKINQAQ